MPTEDLKKFCTQMREVLRRQKDEIESGKVFNFFDALSLKEKELIHSRVICTLLSPEGRHGLDSVPLRCFFQRLRGCGIDLFGYKCGIDVVRVYREYYIGAIDANYENGGSIDILVDAGGFRIAIENKIKAGDQPKQLYRYAKWLKEWRNAKTDRECFLIYLTPNGRLPSENSTHKKVFRLDSNSQLRQTLPSYLPLSYEFISGWLGDILRQCESKTMRSVEFLKQYKEVVDGMNNNGEDEEIIEHILQGNLGVAEAVTRVYDKARNSALRNVLKKALQGDMLDDVINKFDFTTNDVKNALLLQQINADLSLAVATSEGRLIVGVVSGTGGGAAVAEFLNKETEFNSPWEKENPTDWWPLCFESPEEITGSFLDDPQKVKKLTDDILGIISFIKNQGRSL